MIFVTPLALLGLVILPPLYVILRLTPPAARRIRFPPIALLQNLPPGRPTPHQLPLWLLVLRLAAVTCLIIGFAGPFLRPPKTLPGQGRILLVIDNGWAAAAVWPQLIATAQNILAGAQTQNRSIAILTTARNAANAPPAIQAVLSAAAAQRIISALQPEPWPSDRKATIAALRPARETTRLYLADGMTDGPDFSNFISVLKPEQSFAPNAPPALLAPASLSPRGQLIVHAIFNPSHAALLAIAANGDTLASAKFDPAGNASIGLPPQISRKIAKFVLAGPPTAGGTVLLDSAIHTLSVGLASRGANADAPFTGTLYFLRRALPAGSQIVTAAPASLLNSKLDMVVLADLQLTTAEQTLATHYVTNGGVLLRFSGPNTAAAPDGLSASPLLAGARHLGGALTWAAPAQLSSFAPDAPFAGIAPDPTTTVTQQVIADPATLGTANVWAKLQDGTPFILGRAVGQGYLVNILTTANTAWSNFALSGVYPLVMARLAALAQGAPQNPDLALPLATALDAFGTLRPATAPAWLAPARRHEVNISAAEPPGLYGSGAGAIALNLGGHIPPSKPAALAGATPFGATLPALPLGPDLVAAAMLLLGLDLALSLAMRGALTPRFLAVLLLLCWPGAARAQSAALQTELGYILTNDPATDQITAAGLSYLSIAVSAHSSAALGPPVPLHPGSDDLNLYPLIYWPLLPNAAAPSQAACGALTSYMTHGGLLVIDSAGSDAGASGSGAGFAPGIAAALSRVTACLNLPPMVPLTTANVLAHSFFIIQSFPGRFTGAPVLTATPAACDADGVTPILIAHNDFVGAWARDATGTPELAPLPGGEDQRVIAERFGINLVIYALTGAYKSDQIFAPVTLDQLGQ